MKEKDRQLSKKGLIWKKSSNKKELGKKRKERKKLAKIVQCEWKKRERI